jgi:putative membrane protein
MEDNYVIMIGGPLLVLLALIGVVAIVVWILQWANDHRRTRTAFDILDERFARGEIDGAEYDDKRKLIGSR